MFSLGNQYSNLRRKGYNLPLTYPRFALAAGSWAMGLRTFQSVGSGADIELDGVSDLASVLHLCAAGERLSAVGYGLQS